MTAELNLDYTEARLAIDAIIAEITRRGKSAVIAVADSHGELIALARMPGASLASVNIVANKAFTAARAGKPSFDVGVKVRNPEQSCDISYYGDSRFCGWGGGVPVKRDGRVVGSVAVSGLPEAEDMEVVQVGIAAIGA